VKSRVNRKARPCRANEACRDEKKEIAREERKKRDGNFPSFIFFSLAGKREDIPLVGNSSKTRASMYYERS